MGEERGSREGAGVTEGAVGALEARRAGAGVAADAVLAGPVVEVINIYDTFVCLIAGSLLHLVVSTMRTENLFSLSVLFLLSGAMSGT